MGDAELLSIGTLDFSSVQVLARLVIGAVDRATNASWVTRESLRCRLTPLPVLHACADQASSHEDEGPGLGERV